MGHLKKGNERPIHITLSFDDVARLKAAVLYHARWEGTDDGKVTRVYMTIDAAVGAAGYYPDEQPQVYHLRVDERLRLTESRLERLREDAFHMGLIDA